ncbi:MAG: glutamate formimidoyltransferase [Candidatus Poseidoniaceae archaeon]
MNAVVECVPNISEGRDIDLVNAVVQAAKGEGCTVLSVEPDGDYNRTVITMAGEPGAVADAAVRLSVEAIRLIDMRTHSGEHPRLGAVDVCPFIPIQGIDMDACAALATDVAMRVAEETGAPTFLYEASATHPSRRKLSSLRKGEYEGLEVRMTEGLSSAHLETRHPDFGPKTWSEIAAKSGGCTYGARPVLIAYNVNVPEPDATVAKKIGTIIRGSGRIIARNGDAKLRAPGMIQSVQGMGVVLEQQNMSQVSMNLTDAGACGLLHAFETVKSLASDHGLEVTGSELVGLVPLENVLEAGRWYAPDATSDAERVEAAITGLGLDAFGPFDPKSRIIEWALQEAMK